MSLNGLDSSEVKEAHEQASAEAGGWFLLKYVQRDEIGILGKGNGGIVEMRNAIAQFGEPAPLFGFLKYRRRNVLIKYVPDDCSRLVKARLAVHFNAVSEKFWPHDTVFSIADAKDLGDTALSAACSLHTSSASTTSSNSSLRRRGLMEIAEEEEEEKKRDSVVPEDPPPPSSSPTHSTLPAATTPDAADTPASTDYTSIADSSSPLGPRRGSSQSARPDLPSYSPYASPYSKPKVKLGPRPSLEGKGTKSHPPGPHFRPVSQLPAGLKLLSKTSKKTNSDPDRPKSQHKSDPGTFFFAAPPIPESSAENMPPQRPHTAGATSTRPNTSSGHSAHSVGAPGLSKITPEKARLMKALEMRKKQMNAKIKKENLKEEAKAAKEETLPVPSIKQEPEAEDQPRAPTVDAITSIAEEQDEGRKMDIAIPNLHAVIASPRETKYDDSVHTKTDSTPVSPTARSEKAVSTKASSISESTDETVREIKRESVAPEDIIAAKLESTSIKAEEDDPLTPVLGSATIGEDVKSDAEPSATLKNAVETSQTTADPSEAPKQDEALPSITIKHEETEEQVLQDEPIVQEVPLVLDLEPIHKVRADMDIHQTLEELKTPIAQVSEEPKIESNHDNEAAAQDLKPQVKEWKIPRSKFAPEPSSNAPAVQPASPEPQIEKEEPQPAFKEWKIPRSKFSVQDEKAAEGDKPLLPRSTSEESSVAVSRSPTGSVRSNKSKRSFEEHNNPPESPESRKKRKSLNPIQTTFTPSDSDVDFSDDEFMDELHSATVQEAKPVQMPKSPMFPSSPAFPSSQNGRSESPRVVSDPTKTHVSSLAAPARAVSTRSSTGSAYLNAINSQQNQHSLAKKVNIGSGISQRIKALERMSSSSPGAPPAPSPGPQASFFSVASRAPSRLGSQSPSIRNRADSLTRGTVESLGLNQSRSQSPETEMRGRSNSIKARQEQFVRTNSDHSMSRRSSRLPETGSVTSVASKRNSLIMEMEANRGMSQPDHKPAHNRHSTSAASPFETSKMKETIHERRGSDASHASSTERRKRSSLIIVRDALKDLVSEGRRSTTIEHPEPTPKDSSKHSKDKSKPPSAHWSPRGKRPISMYSRSNSSSTSQVASPTARSSGTSTPEEKQLLSPESNSGGARNIMKRMSSSLSNQRKAIAALVSPTLREESSSSTFANTTASQSSLPPTSSAPTLPSSPPAPKGPQTTIEIGDVNVQFPDTLLWKRRCMKIDSQGFLILGATVNGTKFEKAAAAKRYFMGGFGRPYVPDVEVQELPNSVVLDLVEGGGSVQVACEGREGQMRVLRALQEAHQAWSQ